MEVEEDEDEKQKLKRARQLAGITEAMIADMTEFNQVLSTQRKKREVGSSAPPRPALPSGSRF